jgi:hypothetical protein
MRLEGCRPQCGLSPGRAGHLGWDNPARGAILARRLVHFPKAIRALRHFSLDMNVLMSVAVIGAACIGEWTEAAAVVFLFALSELLEGFSVGRARRAIQSLLELTPETALVKRGDQIQEVRVEEVKVDETSSSNRERACRSMALSLPANPPSTKRPSPANPCRWKRNRATPCSREQSTAKARSK